MDGSLFATRSVAVRSLTKNAYRKYATHTNVRQQPQLWRCVSTILSKGSSTSSSSSFSPSPYSRSMQLSVARSPTNKELPFRVCRSSNLNYLVSRSFIIIGPVGWFVHSFVSFGGPIGSDRTNSIRKDGHANSPTPILFQPRHGTMNSWLEHRTTGGDEMNSHPIYTHNCG